MKRPIRPPVSDERLSVLLEWLTEVNRPGRQIEPDIVEDLRSVCVELEERRRHANESPA